MEQIITTKIRESHLARNAIIYIRQSSEHQVRTNTESTHLQYSLKERAIGLGWPHPLIIDEDLGKTADYYAERPGFQRLVTQVSMGDVGIVISLEATRLARNNRDWYHLIDLCTLFDTLIGDHQTVYDPKDPNDRLVLGVKGTLSEAELNLIKTRMRQGTLSKAHRGDLYTIMPIGYILTLEERVEKSPDLREQNAIALVFEKFRELGSARQTHLWFVQEKREVPVNCKGRDPEGRKKRWQLPTSSFIKALLHNPFYAGAYAYGKRGSRMCYQEGHIKKTCGHFKNREDWLVLIKEHHEGYISWEEYEENIKHMSTNQYKTAPDETVGAVRKGRGLLVGLLRCQRCGRKMQVRYWGRSGTNPRYVCQGEFYYGGSYCQSFSAIKTDRVFEEELFRAIEPAALQASIEACDLLDQRYQEKIAYLKRELEAAQYTADRAFAQYNLVDPANRLVASELERRWNEKLEALNEIKERIDNEKKNIQQPNSGDREKVLSLADRLPEVWRHPDTDPAIKKRIIRVIVEEVLIHLDEERSLITMTIHWKGGIHTQAQFKKPLVGDHKNKTDEEIVELLQKLAPYYPDEEIARTFNCHKFKTGMGNQWTRSRVRGLRNNHTIPPCDRAKLRDVVSLNEAIKILGVNPYTVRELIRKGVIRAQQIIKHAPFLIERSDLEKEEVLTVVGQIKEGGSLRSIGGVNKNQLGLFQ